MDMKSFLLGSMVALMLLVGCESNEVHTEENTDEKTSTSNEIVSDTASFEKKSSEDELVYDDEGIIVCEEDDIGMCINDDLQDLRAAQLLERHYVTNQVGNNNELGEYGDIADEEYVDPLSLPPITIWGRDLSNAMAAYPQDAQQKYGDRKLIINGQVVQVFADGVTLGYTFVGVYSDDLKKGDVITVYCNGAYPVKSSWAITTVAKDCFR